MCVNCLYFCLLEKGFVIPTWHRFNIIFTLQAYFTYVLEKLLLDVSSELLIGVLQWVVNPKWLRNNGTDSKQSDLL